MSVLIKGMEMPPTCRLCKFGFYDRDWKMYLCDINDEIKIEKSDYYTCRHSKCPLVEVPTPHGDLIDRQKLLEDNKHLEYPTDGKYRRDRAWATGFNSGASHCNSHAVYAQTVIEAESEE